MRKLTRRQLQIIGMLGMKQMEPAEIQEELGISATTYRNHVMEARLRTGKRTTAALMFHMGRQVPLDKERGD